MGFALAAEQAITGAFGQILASCSSQFVFPLFPRLSSPVLAPLLFSSSLVSCVQLCLQTRLRWWICGCSVSVCLTLWCISTGLNSLSISPCLPSLPLPTQVSFSLRLFVSDSLSLGHPLSLCLCLILSLSMNRHCLASCLSDGTDRTHRPTTTNNNNSKQELSSTICPLIFTGGISEIAHLTFRPNASEWRKQSRLERVRLLWLSLSRKNLCQRLSDQHALLVTWLWDRLLVQIQIHNYRHSYGYISLRCKTKILKPC